METTYQKIQGLQGGWSYAITIPANTTNGRLTNQNDYAVAVMYLPPEFRVKNLRIRIIIKAAAIVTKTLQLRTYYIDSAGVAQQISSVTGSFTSVNGRKIFTIDTCQFNKPDAEMFAIEIGATENLTTNLDCEAWHITEL